MSSGHLEGDGMDASGLRSALGPSTTIDPHRQTDRAFTLATVDQ